MQKDLLALLLSPFHLLVTVLLEYITFSPNREGIVYMSFPRLLATDLQQKATFSSSGNGIVYMDLHHLLLQEFVSIFVRVERINLLPHFTRLCFHHVLVMNCRKLKKSRLWCALNSTTFVQRASGSTVRMRCVRT